MSRPFRFRNIFNTTSTLVVGHIVFFVWAYQNHPSYLQGGDFNWSVAAYPLPWISLIGIEMVTHLSSNAEKIVFFVLGLVQMYAVGSYFDGFAKRVS